MAAYQYCSKKKRHEKRNKDDKKEVAAQNLARPKAYDK